MLPVAQRSRSSANSIDFHPCPIKVSSNTDHQILSERSQPLLWPDFSRQTCIEIYHALKKEETCIQIAVKAQQNFSISMVISEKTVEIKQFFTHGEASVFVLLDNGVVYSAQYCLCSLIVSCDYFLHRSSSKYSTSPPIKVLTFENIEPTIEIFLKHLEKWDVKLPPFNREKDAWHERVFRAQVHLEAVKSTVGFHSQSVYYVYEVSGNPVGIMVVSPVKNNLPYIYIERLATHPGSTGVGGALIEWAVARSCEAGKGGKLRLEAANEQCQSAYLAMGFVFVSPENDAKMILDPATAPDKWVKNAEGAYRLKNHANQGYMHTAFNNDLSI